MSSRGRWKNGASVALVIALAAITGNGAAQSTPPPELARFFRAPSEYHGVYGEYRSPLVDKDGIRAATPDDWQGRREALRDEWHEILGRWPALITEPRSEFLSTEKLEGVTRVKVQIGVGIGAEKVCAYLLTPDGEGPFPAVLVVYYEPETGAGLGVARRDFALQLARRGFVTLSIGPPGVEFQTADGAPINSKRPYYGPVGAPVRTQPLSALAYAAANCHTFLAQQANVDGNRIGVIGHSFGGKWAMFASCLYDKFACAVWSDAGIVFDERKRSDNPGGSINYWDRWYLGYPLGQIAAREESYRFRPIPRSANDRTGSYQQLIDDGRDLVELHALMAPRPLLVSGGSADREERWAALNHSVDVNRLLGQPYGVAMTNRPAHAPTEESNDVAFRFMEWCLNRE